MKKPHLQRRSDFLSNNAVAEHNDAGILVTRVGNEYRFAVELDVDTVVEVDATQNKHEVTDKINDLIPQLPSIRERFDQCFRED